MKLKFLFNFNTYFSVHTFHLIWLTLNRTENTHHRFDGKCCSLIKLNPQFGFCHLFKRLSAFFMIKLADTLFILPLWLVNFFMLLCYKSNCSRIFYLIEIISDVWKKHIADSFFLKFSRCPQFLGCGLSLKLFPIRLIF